MGQMPHQSMVLKNALNQSTAMALKIAVERNSCLRQFWKFPRQFWQFPRHFFKLL